MKWIATNIRFPEDQYMELKMEAARKRKSVASLVREKVLQEKHAKQRKVDAFLRQLDKVAEQNAKELKGESLSRWLIKMRYEQQ